MRRLLLSSVLAVSLAPVPASAATLSFEGLGKAGVVTVRGLVSATVYAGELNWSWLSGQPSDLPSLIYTYCIDIVHHAASQQDVTVRSTDGLVPPGPGGSLNAYTPHAGTMAAWLFNTFAAGIHTTGTNIEAAALQVALWEVLYDRVHDLTAGNLVLVTNTSFYGGAYAASILNQAQTYLTALANVGTGYRSSQALWLDAPIPEGQDQIAQIPEPGLLVLLGIGVFTTAAVFRRAARKNAARPRY